MNKLLCFLIVFFLSLNIYSQSQKQRPVPVIEFNKNIDAPLTVKERFFIEEAYGSDAENLIFNNAFNLKQIKNILRNRVNFVTYENKDLSSITPFSSVALKDPKLKRDFNINQNNFNPLKYNFNFFSRDKIKYYRIDNTQTLIQVLPQF